jgi:hypothetical protein
MGAQRNLVLNAYGLRTRNEGVSGNDASYGFAAEFPNDRIDMQLAYREVQPNFRPALGFVQRTNIRQMRIGASYNPRPRDFLGIQQMFHDVYYTRVERLDTGELESWDLYAALVDWHFNSGDSLHAFFDYNPAYERLFAPFTIFPGVVLPVDEYRFTRWRINFASAAKRRLVLSGTWTFGEFWSGTADAVTTSLTYKIPPQFSFVLTTNQTFAHLPQGNFVARIYTSQVNFATSPFLAFSSLIQYDNLSRNLGWQGRVRWTIEPGSDLFFVVGQGLLQDADGGFDFRAQDTRISTKLQYTFRF